MMKNQKGITLIALVITIIVLLILAGVSIAMLTGENGLLSRAKSGANTNAIAGAKDEVSLIHQDVMTEYLTEKYTSTSTSTKTFVETFVARVNAMTAEEKHGCTVSAADDGEVTIGKDGDTVTGTITTEADTDKYQLTWSK